MARLGIAEGVRLAKATWPARTVHVEADSLEKVAEALAAGADAILLDNLGVDGVRAAVELANAHPGPRPLLEASGGITLDTIGGYADHRRRRDHAPARSPSAHRSWTSASTSTDLLAEIGHPASSALSVARRAPGDRRRQHPDRHRPVRHRGQARRRARRHRRSGRAERDLLDHWRIATTASRTSDELALLVQEFLGLPRVQLRRGRRRRRPVQLGPVDHRRRAGDDPPLLRVRGPGDRAGRQDRHADPLRQPQGGRRRPHRRRRRRLRPLRRPHDRRRLRHRHAPSRRSAPAASTSAAPSSPASTSASRPCSPGPPRCARSSWSSPATSSARTPSSRSSREPSTASPGRSTASPTGSSTRSARPPSSPPAAWPRSSRPTPARSPSTSRGSPCTACG